ncbi:MAG: hypothetical protein PHR87_00715 [Sulfurospirillaceae bacterium]|nr:hypothetical protein [Sulfurospirillaceae bacterium]
MNFISYYVWRGYLLQTYSISYHHFQKKHSSFVYQYIYFFLILLSFYGCNTTISSKKFNQDFVLESPSTLYVDNMLPYESIATLFYRYGLSINQTSTIHINITTNSQQQHCSLASSSIAKENFVRISIVEDNEEMYRIQCNKQEDITIRDIEELIKKLCKDVKKKNDKG